MQVKDEFALVTGLSHHLSICHQTAEEPITIDLHHSACVLLGGSFEPAYIMTVTALPTQLKPTTNNHNAALLQTFMAKALNVLPERGIIRFVPILAEHLASNGKTIQGELERLQREDTIGAGRNTQQVASKKASRRLDILRSKSSKVNNLARRRSQAV